MAVSSNIAATGGHGGDGIAVMVTDEKEGSHNAVNDDRSSHCIRNEQYRAHKSRQGKNRECIDRGQ